MAERAATTDAGRGLGAGLPGVIGSDHHEPPEGMPLCLAVSPHATPRRRRSVQLLTAQNHHRHPQSASNSKNFGLQEFIGLCPERSRVVSPSVNVIQKRLLTVRIKRGFQRQCQGRHKQIDAFSELLLRHELQGKLIGMDREESRTPCRLRAHRRLGGDLAAPYSSTKSSEPRGASASRSEPAGVRSSAAWCRSSASRALREASGSPPERVACRSSSQSASESPGMP